MRTKTEKEYIDSVNQQRAQRKSKIQENEEEDVMEGLDEFEPMTAE